MKIISCAKLRAARKRCGYTQEQIADVLGVGRTTYLAIERGDQDISQEEEHELLQMFGEEICVEPELRLPNLSSDATILADLGGLDPASLSVYREFVDILNRYSPVTQGISFPQTKNALQERARIGAGSAPLKTLRNEIEQFLPVVALSFSPDYSCVSSPRGFLLNQNVSQEERLYGLAIAYGCQILGDNQVRLIASHCPQNDFADDLLLPRDGILSVLPEEPDIFHILHTSHFYGVSPQVLARRLKMIGVSHDYEFSPRAYCDFSRDRKLPFAMLAHEWLGSFADDDLLIKG